jgi:hypothetical protein
MIEILRALLLLGLPMFVLSWFLFFRLYQRRALDRADDEKTSREKLKALKKQVKERGVADDLLQHRWMKFGGGFYGAAALWTFVVIELTDVRRLLVDFPGFAALFDDGIISLVVGIFVNQIQNFVSAMVWFVYWGSDGSMLAWVAVAYGGWLTGVSLARLGAEASEPDDWMRSAREWWGGRGR